MQRMTSTAIHCVVLVLGGWHLAYMAMCVILLHPLDDQDTLPPGHSFLSVVILEITAASALTLISVGVPLR